MKGRPLDSIWDDIPPVQPHATKRQGFPTQKPVALLERIIQASSNPGDVVLDAFCGSGTTLVAAQKLDRRWLGIDMVLATCRLASRRLVVECQLREGQNFSLAT